MKPWAKARGSAAYYAHWDDHEFVNDFARGESMFPLGVGDVNIDGEELYKRGVRAFTDYNPIAYKKQTGLYRSVRWGKNLEIFFLDERSFRTYERRLPGQLRQPGRQRQPRPRADRARRAPATCSRPSPRRSPTRRRRHASRRSTTRAARCSARTQLAKFKQAIAKLEAPPSR